MKANNVNGILGTAAAIATMSALPMIAHGAGTLIVNDSFDRVGTLAGSSSDSGHTWVSTSTFPTTGATYQVNGDSASFASIDGLTFAPNSTYCLTVDVEILFPFSDGWLGVGFKRPASTDAFTSTVGTFVRKETAEVETFLTGSSPGVPYTTSVGAFPNNLEIILDTGATLASSTLSWELDSVPVRGPEAVDATGIDGIFLAHDATDDQLRGTFDRLQLLGPVPEPSALMMLALGGLGVVVRRKR